MTLFDLGAFILGLANLAGIAWLLKWIRALKGTVTAQEIVLKTLSGLNATVLEVIKALDPERWAKEAQIHKRLADEKAESIVEAERRRLAALGQTDWSEMKSFLEEEYTQFYTVIMRLMIQTPRRRRAAVINGMADLGQGTRDRLLKAAEELPDESFESRIVDNLEALESLKSGGAPQPDLL